MSRDDIIRMAREAGLRVGTNISGVTLVGSPAEVGLNHLTIDELEGFAALAITAAVAAEREACVKVCDDEVRRVGQGPAAMVAGICAAAIRARGDA